MITVFGVSIHIGASHGFLLGLVLYSFVDGRDGISWPSLLAGVALCLGITASIVLHELAHTAAAQRCQLAIRRIELHFFGGNAAADEPCRPDHELLISFVGPLMSLLLGAIFCAATCLCEVADWTALTRATTILTVVNLIMAAFNMLPAFPMDGGRIVRSLVWLAIRDYRRATTLACYASFPCCAAIGGFGIATGLWMMPIIGVLVGLVAYSRLTDIRRLTRIDRLRDERAYG